MKAHSSAFVYALLDAEGRFDYVGQTVNPKKRFWDHKTVGIILAEVPWDKRKECECYFIALFSAQGCRLRNKNKGGGGPNKKKAWPCRLYPLQKARWRLNTVKDFTTYPEYGYPEFGVQWWDCIRALRPEPKVVQNLDKPPRKPHLLTCH